MLAYRLVLLVLMLAVFSAQKAVELHAPASTKEALGYGVTLALLGVCVEFSALLVGRRLFRSPGEEPRLSSRAVLGIATAMFGLNLASKFAAGFLAVVPKAHNARRIAFVMVPWLGFLGFVRRRGSNALVVGVGLGFLVMAARVLGLVVTPFDRIRGDMLETIDRSLDLLSQGRYPYVNFPPPMPYWPAMFLSYLPPKLTGIDLRWTNVAMDGLLAYGSVVWVPGALGRGRATAGARTLELEQAALPLLLLWPTVVFYAVETHYSPCLMAAAVLARSLVHAKPAHQSLALALAISTNQSFLPFAPLVGLWWCRRHGAARAATWLLGAAVVVLVTLAPFVAWGPRQFVEVTLGSIGPLPRELMHGRFTVRPWLEDVSPWLPTVASGVVGLGACVAALKVRTARGLVAVLAISYLALLLLLVRSFSHYPMPTLVMLAACPTAWPRPAVGAAQAPLEADRRV